MPQGSSALPARLSPSAISWALYEGGRDPYIILVMSYIFMPFVAISLIRDPVAGQAAVASMTTWVSLIAALTVPLLGATLDHVGRKKPWLALLTIPAIPALCLLWFASPSSTWLGANATLFVLGLITVLVSWGDVVFNAMLPRAALPSEIARASGLALSLGNAIALVMLVFLLWGCVLPGQASWFLIPDRPLFGLDGASGEPDRLSAPLVGLFWGLCLVPLLMFCKNGSSSGHSARHLLKLGLLDLRGLIKGISLGLDMRWFIGGRTLYFSGNLALLFFGGVYAAGVMHLGTMDLLMLAVVNCIAGVPGGWLGGWLDTKLGARRAFVLEIALTVFAVFLQVGITPSCVFYLWHVAPPATAGAVFSSASGLAFLSTVVMIGVIGTSSYASSRTLLVEMSPPGKFGAYFGIITLVAAATSWLAPLLIEKSTTYFNSQQAGFAPIILLMLLGLACMLRVRGASSIGLQQPAPVTPVAE